LALDQHEYDDGTHHGFPRAIAFFFGFAFTLFVAGGFYSGWVFLNNYRELSSRGRIHIAVGPAAVDVEAPPTIFSPSGDPLRGIRDRIQQPVPKPADLLPNWTGTERINVVLMGIDQRDDEPVDGTRSDTIMVLSVDPTCKTAAMISFPRDLWVNIPGAYPQRINVAHALGGPDLLQRTLDTNFGIKSKYFARVNFRGFEQIVDTIGGVIVDVERPIKDDEYPTEDYGYQRLYIPAGPQLMDGKLALMFARSRHSENDFGRARRQQRVLVSLRDRGMQLNMLPRVPALVGLAQQTVATNFAVTELLALAKLGSEIDREQITNLVVDSEYADPFIGDGGAQVLRPRLGDVRAAVQRITSAGCVAKPTEPKIEVLNGTSRQGLATVTGEQLQQLGFQITRVDAADRQDYPDTQVFYYNGQTELAARIAAALKLPATAIRPGTGTSQGDIRVILGRNFPS
jgi:LCP family protein required for cell wall assembly